LANSSSSTTGKVLSEGLSYHTSRIRSHSNLWQMMATAKTGPRLFPLASIGWLF